METSHFSDIVPSYVETGQVIDVDIETYTVSVVTQFTQKPLTGLAFSTPYQHFANGEGIYFMPEVGSLVWLCWPSDGSRPFVLGWSPAREDSGSLRSKKMALNPGDIYLGTRDENFIILRRGGIVQIGGGPLSQRMFIPINNAIKDFCENYSLFALGGSLEWTIDREASTTDGKRPGLLTVKAREYANDPEPIAILQIGSHKGHSKNILSLVIKESGSAGAATKISLEFRKDGTANWKYWGAVEWKFEEDLSVTVENQLTLTGKTKATLSGGTTTVEATKGNLDIKAQGVVNVVGTGGSVNVGPQLNVGVLPGGSVANLKSALLADQTFLTWLMTHVHLMTKAHPTETSGPPRPFTGSGHISKQLKAK